MKCHWCKKYLEIIKDPDDPSALMILECPDDHLQVLTENGKMFGYKMFWDADVDAVDRYKLSYRNGITTLQHSYAPQVQNRKYRSYKIIMEIPQEFPLIIKDDIVQFDNLINRLQKLKVFS